MTEISCKVCDAGRLFPQKVHRMSGPAVTIGYILLIPSLIGLLVSFGFLILSWTAAAQVATTINETTARELRGANVPEEFIRQLKEGKVVSQSELSALTTEKRRAVEAANLQIAGSLAGAGCAGACGTGLAGVGAVISFVGGLVGWLLVMKKRVLTCNACGATIAAG
jgi:hypothetical protein